MSRVVLCSVLLSSGALADGPGVPRVLLDRRLIERPVTLLTLDASTVGYLDVGGLQRSEPLRDYLAVLPAPGDELPVPAYPTLWLTDGQRFTGSLAGAGSSDTLSWRNAAMGRFSVPLEDVGRVALMRPKSVPAPAREGDDLVLLSNGDSVSGFVSGIGSAVTIEVGGDAREVPIAVVTEIRFANDPRPPGGATVWLSDGTAVRARSVSTNRMGGVRIEPLTVASETSPEAGPEPLSLADISALAFDASGLVPLAGLAVASITGHADRVWTPPPRTGPVETALLGAPDITLPGPMTVEWILPPDATVFSCRVELPEGMRDWGDCELIVSSVTGANASESFRQPITGEAPVAVVAAPIAPGAQRLRIELAPGRYGPIQDRLILGRPFVVCAGAQ